MTEYRKDFREFQREFYWSMPRVLIMVALTVVCLATIGFGLYYAGYARFAIFAPMEEAVRRDVMIKSRAYSEATTRRLYELKIQYDTAPNDDAKAAIRSLTLHEARAFDRSRLPRDLQLFISQLGG
jgi:hypothetical protein